MQKPSPETTATCVLCGEPMPAGEEMFKFHGYSGPCPKPPLRPKELIDDRPRNPATGDPYPETGWLIELKSGGPRWWTGNLFDDSKAEWTTDSLEAIRFAREVDANKIIKAIGWTDAVATDHRWG